MGPLGDSLLGFGPGVFVEPIVVVGRYPVLGNAIVVSCAFDDFVFWDAGFTQFGKEAVDFCFGD